MTITIPKVTKAEFATLAGLAWNDNPKKLLAIRIAEDTGFPVRKVEYWFSDNSDLMPPDAVVSMAIKKASDNFEAIADLLDRLAPQ